MTNPPLVHEGEDGWLFLRGGSNFVSSLYAREAGNLPDGKLALWCQRIEERSARAHALGIKCVHVVVPDKLTIYGDKQGKRFVDPDQAPAIRLAEQALASRAAPDYLDLVAPMRAARDEVDLFWRTDSHWSPAGCHLGYRAICAHLGLTPEDDLLERAHTGEHRPMDLGGRLDPIRYETIRKYDYARKARRVWTNSITACLEDPAYGELIHVGARARFDNPAARNDCKLLLVGDSYAGASSGMLTGMLAETVRSLEFVWSSEVDWRLVRAIRPDFLVFELAERFLATQATDRRAQWLLELRQNLRAWRLRRECAKA